MSKEKILLRVEEKLIASKLLSREVKADIYLPRSINSSQCSLLLINDGQDLLKMNFSKMLEQLLASGNSSPLCCVSIHAGDRFLEYGTSKINDFMGRGANSECYQQFITTELLPFIHTHYGIEQFRDKAIAGFSLGGLSAIDTALNYPDIFSTAAAFSGSFWWRRKDLNEGYNEETDRILHQKVKTHLYKAGLRFYFTTGSLDETVDRNNNGIIDSIDDTLALIEELKKKGYADKDIRYINYEDGRHDVASWGKAMPAFLLWGWGRK